MMTNENKKPLRLWAHRLFKQADANPAALQGKIYFAHRYHVLERNPFSVLFSGAEKEKSKQDHIGDQFLRMFEQCSPLQNDIPVMIDPVQNGHSNPVRTPSGRADLKEGDESSAQFVVLNYYEETPDTKTFRLGRLDGRIMYYLPGQYLTLSIVISGQEFKRSYSLASSPSRPHSYDITVKRDANGGIVSNWLNDHLKIGDTLNFRGPFGKFSCLKQMPIPQKILFLAAGSGIVPIISMLRWLTDVEARVDVRLLLSFRSPEDILYRDELELFAARHKNIKMAVTLTTDAIDSNRLPGLTGRVNERMIHQLAPDLPERSVYCCGPDAFMSDCKKYLLKLGLPPQKLFCESFTVSSPPLSPEKPGLTLSLSRKTGNYRVSFAKSGKSITTDGRATLLELAEMSGISIKHECRNGQCGECMVKCLKGKIEMTDQAEIDNLDKKCGWVYACCAYPKSNVDLDL